MWTSNSLVYSLKIVVLKFDILEGYKALNRSETLSQLKNKNKNLKLQRKEAGNSKIRRKNTKTAKTRGARWDFWYLRIRQSVLCYKGYSR